MTAGSCHPTGHPAIHDRVYRIAAEMAKAGDYGLLATFAVPQFHLLPSFIPASLMATFEFDVTLCPECSLIPQRLFYLDDIRGTVIETLPYGPHASQLDLDIKQSIEEMDCSAKGGCVMCTFILATFQNMPHRLEQHACQTS